MNHYLQVTFAVIAFICGIGIIVFSVIDIPGSMTAMVIFGLVMMVMALIMWVTAISKRNKELRNRDKISE
ncbi:MAG: hypothetical protein J1F38_01605 [Muribaculaceae bacterium]|nr:hypothetical protein [Muribaculaceae bacterium]